MFIIGGKMKIRLFNQNRNCFILYILGNKLLTEKGENARELEEIVFVSNSTNA